MKEIRFTQNSAQGKINGILRIHEKILYLKCNNNQYSAQMISQMKSKGADIIERSGWIRIDLFKDREGAVKLGEFEFDLNNNSYEEIENILTKFYVLQYTKAKFQVTWREVKR